MPARRPIKSEPKASKAPKLTPLTEWRVPSDNPARAPVAEPGSRRMWLIGGVALLVVLAFAGWLFSKPDVADVIAATPVPERSVVPAQVIAKARHTTEFVSHPPIELPGGLQIDRSSIANYDLAAWLATNPTEPHSFTFDLLGFDANSAGIRENDRPGLQVLSQILTAYPAARVTLVANGPGSLGAERAAAIRDALLALGTDAAQLSVQAGNGSEMAPRMDVKVEMTASNGLDA